jgi:hypothetical protein
VRSTPQQHESWARLIQTANSQNSTSQPSLMLILDVITCWSSTHQMLRMYCFLFFFGFEFLLIIFQAARLTTILLLTPSLMSIETFGHICSQMRNGKRTDWLKSFRAATTQMSGTQTLMLSTTHAVLRGLQEDICNILRGLPDTVPPCLKKGLTDVHLKLSTYYYKIDESPFYLWSSCKSCNYLFH